MVFIPVDSLPKTKGPGKEIGRNWYFMCLTKVTNLLASFGRLMQIMTLLVTSVTTMRTLMKMATRTTKITALTFPMLTRLTMIKMVKGMPVILMMTMMVFQMTGTIVASDITLSRRTLMVRTMLHQLNLVLSIQFCL